MSVSTETAFEPLELRLGREHLDAIEGLLARRRALCFDGELGIGAWTRIEGALGDRLQAASATCEEEVLREARLRLRSPVPGEAAAGAFVVGALTHGALPSASALAGTRRDPSPVVRGLEAAARHRDDDALPGAGSLDLDLDLASSSGCMSPERAVEAMRGGDTRGALLAWARGVPGVLPMREEVERLARGDAPLAGLALYALGRALGPADFAPWVSSRPDVGRSASSSIAVAVFGDATSARLLSLQGHAGIRALGWLGVPHALRALMPMLETGAPSSLVRSVATALFVASGRWFVRDGIVAIRRAQPVAGDADAAGRWLAELPSSVAHVRHHLGVPIHHAWPKGDEPMSRRWLRAQLGHGDAPTSRQLPEPLMADPTASARPHRRTGPTDLAFLPPPPGPPWAFEI